MSDFYKESNHEGTIELFNKSTIYKGDSLSFLKDIQM
jgi:hypothetical protein